MARKKKSETSFALRKDENLEPMDLAEALNQFMLQYSAITLEDRAIPAVDGLKPVQRRLLYVMYQRKLVNGKATKLNNIGGYTMLLHPHGDPSPFLYTIAAQWLNNVPFAKIIGNGGTISQGLEDAAATRYTSGTLTEYGEHILSGLSEDAVKMKPSYDGELEEPELLPVEYPNALMNRTSGIGEALTTNIYPHNPKEIIEAMLYYIDHPTMTVKKLASIVKGPDFPTGGLLVNSENANLLELKTGEINSKSKAKYVVRGEAELHDIKGKPFIKFTSIPFDTTISKIMASIKKFVEKHDDLPIKTVLEESSDYDDIDIEIIFNNKTSKKVMEQVLVLLYRETELEKKLYPSNLLIDNAGKPRMMSMLEYFAEWLEFRKKTLRRQFTYRLDRAQKRQEIVEGLLRLVDISDNVVKDAKKSKNKTDFKKVLNKKYKFSVRQAEAIASMALYRLGRQDVAKLTKENKELDEALEKLHGLLSDDKKFMNELKRQLRYLNKTLFKDATRKTKLVEETKIDHVEVKRSTLVKKQDVVVVAKQNGSVQRMSQQVYDNNISDYQDVDQIVFTSQANTQQGGLFFTKKGLTFFRFVSDLENLNVKKDADSVSTVISAYKADDDTIAGTTFDLPMKDLVSVAVSKAGRIKVTDLTKVMPSVSTKRYMKNAKTYFGLKSEDDEVIFVKIMAKKDLKGKSLKIHKTAGRSGTKTVDLGSMNIQGASGSGSALWSGKKLADVDSVELVEK